jgi:hypothetical protein
MMNSLEKTIAHIQPYEELPLDCDGMTRVITYVLTKEQISHSVFTGTIRVEGKGEFKPHFWIRLETGEIVDYRSRLWFKGDGNIPEGIFNEGGVVLYDGKKVVLDVTEVMFKILTGFYR